VGVVFNLWVGEGLDRPQYLQALQTSAQHMAQQMQAELREYFAIPTNLRYGAVLGRELRAQTGAPVLEGRHDAPALHDAWAARERGAYDSAWQRARDRLWTFLDDYENVWITTTFGGPMFETTPLIGFAYEQRLGLMFANPFTWWIPANGGTEVLSGTAAGRSAMSPTMNLLHELDHRFSNLNPDATHASTTGNTAAGFTFTAEDATVRDIDFSMAGQNSVGERGWYGDTTLLVGQEHEAHYRQNVPGNYYFMGDQTAAVEFGNRFMHGAVRPQDWAGAWIQYPTADTLLHGAAPRQPAVVWPPAPPRAPAPPAPAASPSPAVPPVPARHGPAPRHRPRAVHRAIRPRDMLSLQQTVGNRAATRMFPRCVSPLAAGAARSPAPDTVAAPEELAREQPTRNSAR
jgi:hypothetical protein